MIVPVKPPLERLAAERFRSLARYLMQAQEKRNHVEFREIGEKEVKWCRTHPHLNGCRENYEAAVRVLVDLARLGTAELANSRRQVWR